MVEFMQLLECSLLVWLILRRGKLTLNHQLQSLIYYKKKKKKKKEKKIDRVNVNEFDSSVCPNVLSLLYWICIRAIVAKTLIDWYQLITFLRTNSRNWFEVTSLGLIDSIIKKGSPDYWSIDRTLNTKKKKKKKRWEGKTAIVAWIEFQEYSAR